MEFDPGLITPLLMYAAAVGYCSVTLWLGKAQHQLAAAVLSLMGFIYVTMMAIVTWFFASAPVFVCGLFQTVFEQDDAMLEEAGRVDWSEPLPQFYVASMVLFVVLGLANLIAYMRQRNAVTIEKRKNTSAEN
ncbi:MAG: hypothetical protein AAFV33_28685 [Chloroflexota bacterium]